MDFEDLGDGTESNSESESEIPGSFNTLKRAPDESPLAFNPRLLAAFPVPTGWGDDRCVLATGWGDDPRVLVVVPVPL